MTTSESQWFRYRITSRLDFHLDDCSSINMTDHDLLHEAIAEARAGLHEGGLPIGSVLADRQGRIVARGHNLRVQSGDPTAHAETVCIRNAGRRRDWTELTLVSTLSPCIMCTGTALLYRIPRVVIGENRNFLGAEDLFQQRDIELVVLNDAECIEMMSEFIRTHADLWNEDIGK
jgi:cytosine/creatinine deaminase